MFVFSEAIAEELVFVSKLLYDKGLATAYEGNVSIRDGDRIYITPSAVCKGFLTADQVVVMDMVGAVLRAEGVKPSSEYRLHLAAYLARPGVGGIVHAHPPYCTAFAVAGQEIYTPGYPEALVIYGRVPLAPYGRPSTDGIWQGVPKLLADYDAVLLQNHGALTVGRDAREAFFRMESVEGIAKVAHLARALGGQQQLPPEELEALNVMHHKWRQPG